MANDISGRQMILDTASDVPVFNWNVKIKDAFWANSNVGDTLTFTDLGGRSFAFTSNQANYPYAIGNLGWLEGLVLTAIPSGILYLIIDK